MSRPRASSSEPPFHQLHPDHRRSGCPVLRVSPWLDVSTVARAAAYLHKLKIFEPAPMPSYPTITVLLVARLEPPMPDSKVALVMPEPGALALLGDDGQRAKEFAREALAPATRRAYQGDVDAFMAWCRGRGKKEQARLSR